MKGYTGRSRILVFLLLLVSTPALADIFEYTDIFFSFSREEVPDFDQRRAEGANGTIEGLPDDGMMYCVPTSSMNWMAYLAAHGYSNLPPGEGYWQGSPPQYLAEYNHITNNIAMLGNWMGTDPTIGTFAPLEPATKAWLSLASQHFSVYEVYADYNWSPRVKDAALASISGAFVNVNIGWYTEPRVGDTRKVKGGHMVTLVSAHQLFKKISVNDPWTESGLPFTTIQSPFLADESTYDAVSGNYCYTDAQNNLVCYYRTQDRLNYVTSGYMIGYIAVIPKFALEFVDDEIIWVNPQIISGLLEEQVRSMKPFPGQKVLDAAINPIRIQHPYIVEESNKVWMIDSLLGTSEEFATVENPKRLTYGGKKEHLYVLSSDRISRFDRDRKLDKQVALNGSLDALAFDEKRQQLIGVSREKSELLVFTPELELRTVIALDRDALGTDGRLSVSINPTSGEMGVLFAGSEYYTMIEFDESELRRQEKISFPSEISFVESFYLDEYGTIFVSDNRKLVALNSEGQIVEDSPFNGMPGGQAIQIHRSFSNYDPETMPRIRNLTPDEAAR